MGVLVALAERAGQVVTRRRLLETCWADGFVVDEVLTHAVSELRRALEDSRRAPRYIQTVSKSGYRLVAAVHPLDAGPGTAAPARRAADGPSIAVLPFADLSPAGDHGYFCDGIAEELINDLSRVDGLRVASRTSSFRLRQTELDVRAIGEQLAVAAVVEGSVRRFGNSLRVAVRLTDTSSGFQLWSESFEREFEDLFRIQEEIARHTAEALRVRLGADADERLGLGRAVAPSVQAYDLYLQGRHHFYRGGRPSTERAAELFRRAAELAPDYALAHAGSADASAFLYLYYTPAPEALARAERHSRLAVEADPELPEARASRGFALAAAGDYGQAAEQFEAALRLRPDLFEALYLYARSCLAEGRLEKAAELFERAGAARPDDFHVVTLMARCRRGVGDDPGAVAAHRHALDLIEHHLRLVPGDPRAYVDGMCALVELGREADAERWGQRAREVVAPDPLLYYLACGFARAGRRAEALDALTASVEAGWSHADWLRHDPDWSAYRDDPRFAALLGGLTTRS
jgi:TolB-like protein